MKNFREQLIKQDLVIIDAMKKLTKSSESLTLFVLDDQEKMIGTLTDGDIRRGFIDGLTLDDSVSSFMSKQFYSLKSDFTIADFKKSRDKGIKLLPLLDEKGRVIKIYDLKKRKSILPLECMIMAGGRGIRLRPLTDNMPKPMLPLFGKPILEHNIDRLISYGIENGDIQGKINRISREGQEVVIKIFNKSYTVNLKLLGRYNLYNLLGAIGAVKTLGISDEEIISKIPLIHGAPGRFEPVNVESDFTVVVDYAHTGDALENILKSINEFKTNHQ